MQIARIALCVIEFVDQVARQLSALGAAGADDDGVGTRVADHRDFLRRIVARCVEQIRDHRRDVSGDAVLDLHHVGVDRARGVDGLDQLGDASEVLGVIGDDDGVVAGVGIDRVVRRHDRAQHRNQVHRVFVLQAKGTRQHAVAGGFVRAVDRPAEQFRIGFRHHLGDAADIDHAETLHAQRREQHVVGLACRHLTFRDQRQAALDPRVDQKLLAGGTR